MRGFSDYCSKRKLEIFFLFFSGLAVYGLYITQDIVTFDAEGFYSSAAGVPWYDQWYALDRWGLVLLKKLLGTTLINPYFSGAVFLIAFPLSILLWNYAFYVWSGRRESRIGEILFSLIYLTHPIWALQFAYRNQMEVICVVMILLPIAVLLLSESLKRPAVLKWIGALALTILCFGSYQAFYFVFAEACAVCFFLKVSQAKTGGAPGRPADPIIKELFAALIFTAAAFAGNLTISRLLRKTLGIDESAASYLTTQFFWGKRPFSESVRLILRDIKHEVLGDHLVFNGLYALLCVLALFGLILALRRQKKASLRMLTLLFAAGIAVIPFMLECVTASYVVVRSQFAFVFALAFLGRMAGLYCEQYGDVLFKGFHRVLIAVLIVLAVIPQTQTLTRFLYSDVRIMQQDERQFAQIYYKALELGAHEGDAICFVGGKLNYLDESMLEYEVIGYSYFEFVGVYNSRKAIEAMRDYGFDVSYPLPEQELLAAQTAPSMDIWPSGGDSIRVLDGLIIVRVG